MGQTLLQKVWDLHKVRRLSTGQTQLFIGLHPVHEVTSAQAFAMLGSRGLRVMCPDRTFATVDHIVPTLDQRRPFLDTLAEEMLSALERNCREHGIPLYNLDSGNQGIVHVIGPELGLTQPGLTIACGDGAIRVTEIQLLGKRRMPFADFLRGADALFEGDDDLTLGVGT